MIALLKGTIDRRGDGFVVVVCAGVGYKVHVPDAGAFKPGSAVTLHTHEAVREDGHELFGFVDLERLELFERLIGISGIGPRGAQKIVSVGAAPKVKAAIMAGDLAFLTSVPGIGKKTAQKIILELKGVLADEGGDLGLDDEALQALVGLGYTRKQAEEALKNVKGATETRVRAALKNLSR